MRIIEQSVELISQKSPPYKIIERCGRICYKSENKMTDDSATKMVSALKTNKHWAVLEHAYIYFWLSSDAMDTFVTEIHPSKFKYINFGTNHISGSFRAFMELIAHEYHPIAQWILRLLQDTYPEVFGDPDFEDFEFMGDDVKLVDREDLFICTDEEKKVLLPHTLKFITNRGVSHELVRHRVASICQESQRYVDYNKDSGDHQITVIKPLLEGVESLSYQNWHYAMLMAETQYMNLRNDGVSPQIARGVLPNDCKTELAITATESEWQHIINLRYHGTTGAPHPQMKELMHLAYPILKEESNGRIK